MMESDMMNKVKDMMSKAKFAGDVSSFRQSIIKRQKDTTNEELKKEMEEQILVLYGYLEKQQREYKLTMKEYIFINTDSNTLIDFNIDELNNKTKLCIVFGKLKELNGQDQRVIVNVYASYIYEYYGFISSLIEERERTEGGIFTPSSLIEFLTEELINKILREYIKNQQKQYVLAVKGYLKPSSNGECKYGKYELSDANGNKLCVKLEDKIEIDTNREYIVFGTLEQQGQQAENGTLEQQEQQAENKITINALSIYDEKKMINYIRFLRYLRKEKKDIGEEESYIREILKKEKIKMAIVGGKETMGVADIRSVFDKPELIEKIDLEYYDTKTTSSTDIVDKLKKIKVDEKEKNFDIVLIARGGGNELEFDVFNEFEVLKAWNDIASYKMSALGHAPNVTLLDFLSDKYFITPTKAAEFITGRLTESEILKEISELKQKLPTDLKEVVEKLIDNIKLIKPEVHVHISEPIKPESQTRTSEPKPTKSAKLKSAKLIGIILVSFVAIVLLLSLYLLRQSEPKKVACTLEAQNHINTGISFINNGQLDNAIKEFEAAINASPTCALAYANLVSAYVVKKDYNLAIETYKTGLEKAEEDGFLHMTGAIAYAARKDFDLALVSLGKALEKGYKDIDVLASNELKSLRVNKNKEFCELMNKYSIALKDCIK